MFKKQIRTLFVLLLPLIAVSALVGSFAALTAQAANAPSAVTQNDLQAEVPAGEPIIKSITLTANNATAYKSETISAIRSPDAVLWDQPLSVINGGVYMNQDFETANDAYDTFMADDFTNASSWYIDTIFTPGAGWNGFTTLLNASMLHWEIYADNGGVPDGDPYGGNPPVWSLSIPPTDPRVIITNGNQAFPSNALLDLSATPVNLPAGTWWLVYYPSLDSTAGGGQYGRLVSDTTNGYNSQVVQPGGGLGFPTTWSDASVAFGMSQTDFAFRLEGKISIMAVDDVYTTTEDVTLNQPAPGVLDNDTDADMDGLTAVISDTVSNGSLTLALDGGFIYTPTTDFCGVDDFTYYANDGAADSNLANVTLNVTCANIPPIAVDDVYTTTEDVTLNQPAPGVLDNDTDADMDGLTAVLDTDVSDGTLTLNADGGFIYTPATGFCGINSFTYHANDGMDDSSIATVTLNVTCDPTYMLYLPMIMK